MRIIYLQGTIHSTCNTNWYSDYGIGLAIKLESCNNYNKYNNIAELDGICSCCCRWQAVGMDLSKVRGVWRLQAPQRWLTYIRTCHTISHTIIAAEPAEPEEPAAPLAPAQTPRLRKRRIDVRRWFTRARIHDTVSATAPASATGAPAALTQAVQPAAGSATRAGSVEMISPSASQPPLHCAVADLNIALNEQWMWHGTSYQVRYVCASDA